ncbi:hypothetical protein G9A89_013599 [Geosiphon pyriformis]|nr:hypothetical protein G9A89_013599 [Geosiphon pyriformis]
MPRIKNLKFRRLLKSKSSPKKPKRQPSTSVYKQYLQSCRNIFAENLEKAFAIFDKHEASQPFKEIDRLTYYLWTTEIEKELREQIEDPYIFGGRSVDYEGQGIVIQFQTWTLEEVDKFFVALARCGKRNPWEIARRIPKPVISVIMFIDLLEAEYNHARLSFLKPLEYCEIPGARKMSDEWINIEENQSTFFQEKLQRESLLSADVGNHDPIPLRIQEKLDLFHLKNGLRMAYYLTGDLDTAILRDTFISFYDLVVDWLQVVLNDIMILRQTEQIKNNALDENEISADLVKDALRLRGHWVESEEDDDSDISFSGEQDKIDDLISEDQDIMSESSLISETDSNKIQTNFALNSLRDSRASGLNNEGLRFGMTEDFESDEQSSDESTAESESNENQPPNSHTDDEFDHEELEKNLSSPRTKRKYNIKIKSTEFVSESDYSDPENDTAEGKIMKELEKYIQQDKELELKEQETDVAYEKVLNELLAKYLEAREWKSYKGKMTDLEAAAYTEIYKLHPSKKQTVETESPKFARKQNQLQTDHVLEVTTNINLILLTAFT